MAASRPSRASSFEVRQGELVSLIGANGAGKTTTLKAVTGMQPVAAGDIEFMGQSIKGQGAWDLVKQGLVMVPEGRGVLHAHDDHREPADGRLRAQRQARSTPTSRRCSASSRA